MDRSEASPRKTSTLDGGGGARGERAGAGGGDGGLWYLQGPGTWGRSTAASSVTYTSIPRCISSPPPVAKTTCQLSRGGSSGREGGGGGCDSYCLLFGDGGRGPQCWGGGGGASGAPPLSPSFSFHKALGLALGRLQENLNSGPDNRPVLGRGRRHWAASPSGGGSAWSWEGRKERGRDGFWEEGEALGVAGAGAQKSECQPSAVSEHLLPATDPLVPLTERKVGARKRALSFPKGPFPLSLGQ